MATNEQFADLLFPTRGIDLSRAFSLQPPLTTPLGNNVRGFDVLGQRARGGQRPGLSKYVLGQVPGTLPLQELTSCVAVGITPPGPPTGMTQMTPKGVGGTGTQTVTFQLPVTAGNSVLVFVGTGGSYPDSFSDAVGSTYTRISNGSIGSVSASVWLASNTAGGFSSVTLHDVSGNDNHWLAIEIGPNTGHDSLGSDDGLNNHGGTLSWVPTHSPELQFAMVMTENISTRSGPTGWTDLLYGTDNLSVAVKYQTGLASVGAVSWTYAGSGYWQSLSGGIFL